MALKLAQRKVEARGGKKVFCDVRTIGTSMLVAFGIVVFFYCFVYGDYTKPVATKTELGENVIVRHEPELEVTSSSVRTNIEQLSDEDAPPTKTYKWESSEVKEAADSETMQELEMSEKTSDLAINSDKSFDEGTVAVTTSSTENNEDFMSTSGDENVESKSNGDTSSDMNSEDDGITSNSDVNVVQPGETNHPLPGVSAKCDLSQGHWVYDNVSYPLYRTKNCPFADPGFRCQENGRPDTDFMNYRWQPHGCNLPR